MKLKKGQIDEVVVTSVELSKVFGTSVFAMTAHMGFRANGRPVAEVTLSGLSTDEDEEIKEAAQAFIDAVEKHCVNKLNLDESTETEPKRPRGLFGSSEAHEDI